ncbi:hypothetical protein E4U21_006204 [Claviceps maximensis]|nr:hypothetical protein E4U21_006204 [Claviceps maximensis]
MLQGMEYEQQQPTNLSRHFTLLSAICLCGTAVAAVAAAVAVVAAAVAAVAVVVAAAAAAASSSHHLVIASPSFASPITPYHHSNPHFNQSSPCPFNFNPSRRSNPHPPPSGHISPIRDEPGTPSL